MIEEYARVVAVDGDLATVVAERPSACGSCAAKGGCGTSLLAAWFPDRRIVFDLRNHIGARSGDTVVVGLDEGLLQRGSLLLYAVPLTGLLIGALAGERLFQLFGLPSELGAVVSGLLGLGGALLFVRHRAMQGNAGTGQGVRLIRVARRSSVTIMPSGLGAAESPRRADFRN